MGTQITVANRQDRDYRTNCANAGAVADPTADVEINFKEGVSPMEMITALKQALAFVQETVRSDADAAP